MSHATLLALRRFVIAAMTTRGFNSLLSRDIAGRVCLLADLDHGTGTPLSRAVFLSAASIVGDTVPDGYQLAHDAADAAVAATYRLRPPGTPIISAFTIRETLVTASRFANSGRHEACLSLLKSSGLGHLAHRFKPRRIFDTRVSLAWTHLERKMWRRSNTADNAADANRFVLLGCFCGRRATFAKGL